MPKLRNTIINRILNCLEYGVFCREDFNIEFPDDSSTLAIITFKALPKYNLHIDEGHSAGAISTILSPTNQNHSKKLIRTIEKPGEYKNHEVRSHDDIDSAISRVITWVNNIREDIIHSRTAIDESNLDEMVENLQKNIDEKITDPESYFDKNEEDELKKKLDELLKRVSELESKFNIPEKDVKKIQDAVESSKADIKIYPKGVWYKTAGNKILKIMKAVIGTKEGREVLADIAKKLIS